MRRGSAREVEISRLSSHLGFGKIALIISVVESVILLGLYTGVGSVISKAGNGWLKFNPIILAKVWCLVHIIATLVKSHPLVAIIPKIIFLVVEFIIIVVSSVVTFIIELIDSRPGANKSILTGAAAGSIAFSVGWRIGEE